MLVQSQQFSTCPTHYWTARRPSAAATIHPMPPPTPTLCTDPLRTVAVSEVGAEVGEEVGEEVAAMKVSITTRTLKSPAVGRMLPEIAVPDAEVGAEVGDEVGAEVCAVAQTTAVITKSILKTLETRLVEASPRTCVTAIADRDDKVSGPTRVEYCTTQYYHSSTQ